jgi:hypothetical protein
VPQHLTADPDLTGIGLQRSGGDLDQGRLAGPILTDQGVDLAGETGQRGVGEGVDAEEGFGDVAELQSGLDRRRRRVH